MIIGDTHIPDRADRIPTQILKYIESQSKWDIVVFTGDLTCSQVLEWVKSIGQIVYIVKGNIDYLPLPKTQIFNIHGLKIGVHHGDGVYPRGDVVKLSALANRLGTDVLITGHTHSDFVKTSSDKRALLINPGSLTGVWGGGGGSYIPSFMVLLVNPGELTIDTYKLIENTLKSERIIVRLVNGYWFI